MPSITKSLIRVWRGVILLCTLVVSGCDESHTPLPNLRPVFVNLSTHLHPELRTPGGMLRLVEARTQTDALGYGGLLVVRSLTEEAFYAFDLACPNEQDRITAVELRDERVICPVCSSVFEVLLSYGAPIEGPAQRPLRFYQTHYSPTSGLLRITN